MKHLLTFLLGGIVFTVLFWTLLPKSAIDRMNRKIEYEIKNKRLRDSLKVDYLDTVEACCQSYDPRTNTFSVDFKDDHPEIFVQKNIVIDADSNYKETGYKIFHSKLVIGLDTSKDPCLYKFIGYLKK